MGYNTAIIEMRKILFVIIITFSIATLFAQVPCPQCRGRGSIIEREKFKCTTCQGTGLVVGYIKETCRVCKGSGKVQDYKNGSWYTRSCTNSYCNDGVATIRGNVTCNTCKGKKFYYEDVERTCPRCNGHGKINP